MSDQRSKDVQSRLDCLDMLERVFGLQIDIFDKTEFLSTLTLDFERNNHSIRIRVFPYKNTNVVVDKMTYTYHHKYPIEKYPEEQPFVKWAQEKKEEYSEFPSCFTEIIDPTNMPHDD